MVLPYSAKKYHPDTHDDKESAKNRKDPAGCLYAGRVCGNDAKADPQHSQTHQYEKDAGFVDGLVNDFSSTSKKLNSTITEIINAISEVATTISESANGTQNIAERITDIVSLANDIQTEMRSTIENSTKLKAAVGKFKV